MSKLLSLYGQKPGLVPLGSAPSQYGRRSRFGSPSVSRMMLFVRQVFLTSPSYLGPKQPTPVSWSHFGAPLM